MQLTKYKITADKCTGYMMVIYQDNNFKSVLNEFKPALSEKQLNAILNYIPNDPKAIQAIFKAQYGSKVSVEPVRPIGAEPEPETMAVEYPVNEKIALWCRLYAEHTTDEKGEPIKYKTGASEAGKIKGLAVNAEELEKILEVYFKSTEWFTIPKSISNFVKKYNEIRALAYAKPAVKAKKFPLPFDPAFFNTLDTMGQRGYWDHLRLNGYKYVTNAGRGGNWVKVHDL